MIMAVHVDSGDTHTRADPHLSKPGTVLLPPCSASSFITARDLDPVALFSCTEAGR